MLYSLYQQEEVASMRLFIKTLIVLIVASVAMSCSIVDGVYNWGADIAYGTRLPGYNLMTEMPQDWYDARKSGLNFDGEFRKALHYNNMQWAYLVLGEYIQTKVSYKADIGPDTWSSPQDTLARGYGDCDDYSILFINLIYILTGEKFSLILVDSNLTQYSSRAVVDGGFINHAIVQAPNGRYVEPQNGWFLDVPKVGFKYTFHEVFNK
jgi:hypothetical protein